MKILRTRFEVFFTGIIIVAMFLVWFLMHHTAQTILALHSIDIVSPDGSNITIGVEIADEPKEQKNGLMFRQDLKKGSGMLFVFDEPQTLAFWMKNTLIPLDIIFFDDEGVFVSRTTMDPCVTDICPTYPSAGLARYALEVNAYEEATSGVGIGWRLRMNAEEN